MEKERQQNNMVDDWDRASIVQRAQMIFRAIRNCKMDQEKIKRLLEVADQQDQIKLKVLHNAVVKCLKDYQGESTSARLNDWQRAEAALDSFIQELWEKLFATEKSLATILAVVDYLEAEGWKVTKTSVYRHQKEGKLAPDKDGTYQLKDVDKYAKTWLKQKSTGKRVNEKFEEMQRKKLDLEIDTLELEFKRKKYNYEKEIGRYIPRDQMELELATRAGILDAGLKHWVKSHAAEWIRLVEGNMAKVGELIIQMNRKLDEHINSYASSTEYDVVVDAEEVEEN